MEDADLIARVYPVLDIDRQALAAIKTSPLYVAPQRQHPKKQVQQYGRYDRQPTEPPEESDVLAWHDLPCIELRFSDIPRSTHGRIFGRNPMSDVVLPNIKSLSYHHFGLTFDDDRRLIVKDWGSLAGTEVTYDGEGEGKRRGFCWIVGGNRVPHNKKNITITIDNTVQFRIVAAHHDVASQAYIDKVDRFRQGTATAEDLFGNLDLPQRPDTELPTGAHTPSSRAIHLRMKLGEGSFGVVTHFWNVSNGAEYALKEQTQKAIRQKMVDANDWRKEARIMGDLSHPNIVQLLGAEFTPYPQLRLEYVPGGSLEDHENISTVECVSILRQCLSALKYLHGSDPPIVHRDIKPGNILVRVRCSDHIHVKFGDFGLSRDGCDLSTICGTYKYLAPEIYKKQEYVNSGGRERVSYSAAVDIWSLGVVAYEIVYSLPQYETWYQDGGTTWCQKIVDKLDQRDVQRRPDELQVFISSAMVVISPDLRSSAQDCYDRALLLPNESASPDEDSDVNADEKTTFGDENHDSDGAGAEAASGGDRSSYSACDSSAFLIEPSRRVRSGAPPPQSYVSASRSSQKRPTTEFTSSTSSRRRHNKSPDRRGKDIEPTSRQPEADDPLRVCPVDRQAVHDLLSQEMIESSALLRAMGDDPRTTPTAEHRVANEQFRLANSSSCPHTIAYRPSDRTINATHLLKSGDIPRRNLRRFFAEHPGIAKQIYRQCRSDFQGTYISYEDAQVLCTHFKLSPGPIERLMAGGSASVPPDSDVDGGGGIDNGVSNNDSSAVDVPQSFDDCMPSPDVSQGVANPDHYSQVTEASYENGSYLAPTNRSYLQMLN
ncbi:Serine/threonine-protein kinase RAD53 [Tolypocladium ophioglossoides CBS 100239]|uniref:non-specific serine/threonine protein kinase n=1 Tax=Tolypocladium ophioglossoides (strain CBS 100239) TaxID=1163406 RepID=A0A0L0NHE4_TOLOC|nr:Serine/threonine-protein kinase RAD53 [Tolypocladium ophioglossoides CBS 100239]